MVINRLVLGSDRCRDSSPAFCPPAKHLCFGAGQIDFDPKQMAASAEPIALAANHVAFAAKPICFMTEQICSGTKHVCCNPKPMAASAEPAAFAAKKICSQASQIWFMTNQIYFIPDQIWFAAKQIWASPFSPEPVSACFENGQRWMISRQDRDVRSGLPSSILDPPSTICQIQIDLPGHRRSIAPTPGGKTGNVAWLSKNTL